MSATVAAQTFGGFSVDLVVAVIVSLLFLMLGATAQAMRIGHFGYFKGRPFFGDFIVVAILVCGPVAIMAEASIANDASTGVILGGLLPCFTAGLALRENAGFLVANAQPSAR